ncbi:MAG TPA: NADH-ubiquinone oxidoreductase-F iron-sulfur binding region domain-containing protein [Dehalococcoidia bacterium]|nr:NADH-ubiquinone oxidoreductase-F iron-sulfur binding region domain-containing protein [Dehalococcoidia bacterium]
MVQSFTDLRIRSGALYNDWLSPVRPRIDVAIDTSSLAAGADDVRTAIASQAASRNAAVEFGRVTGIGMQWLNPTVTISFPDGTRVLYGPVGTDDAAAIVDEATGRVGAAAALAVGTITGSRPGIPSLSEHPFFSPETERRLLARIGTTDPESLEHYVATGGYVAVERMLDRHQSPQAVRELMIEAGLTGRGGAYFPAGVKWNFLSGAGDGLRTLICNADEGDPGAWVNRILLEGDPHLVLEGMIIAAFATGAEHGFIYIRDEYPLGIERMRQAIAQAEEAGLLGESVLGHEFCCTLEVIRGAGAYVCGEETGLINSVQDERGMPRVKPPFPANPGGGVFGQASNVNNVETYASASLVLRHGAAWYREQGTERNSGTKIFSFSGDVDRVGILEVPWGVPLREALDACGGISGGGALKAIQAGGPLAGYLPARLLDELTLERETFMPYNALVGSGGVIFVGEGTCSIELNAVFADFLEDESCGRCTTCHGGNQRMTEIFLRTAAGWGRREDRHNLELVGDALRYSNCVHGQASPTIMRNTLALFEPEYDAHVAGEGCEALRCGGFTRFRVVQQSDPALAAAQAICPSGAIERDAESGDRSVVDAACVRCGACTDVAPRAIALEAASPSVAKPAPIPLGPPGGLQR